MKNRFSLFRLLIICAATLALSVLNALAADSKGSISGTITAAATQSPMGNICVGAYEPGTYSQPLRLGCTEADGRYSIQDLPAGSYRVQIDMNNSTAPVPAGYLEQFYDHTYDVTSAKNVEVAAGTVTPNIDFALVQGGTISGKVTEADGVTPIKGMCVMTTQVFPEGGYTDGPQGCTGPDGRYTIGPTFRGLVGAFYARVGGAPGSDSTDRIGYAPQYYPGASSKEAAKLITIAPEKDTANIDFALKRPGSISGKVIAGDGSPIANARVAAVNIDTGFNVAGIEPDGGDSTALDGTYTLPRIIETGRYRLFVSADGYASQYYKGASSLEAATMVQGSVLQQIKGIDFVLASYCSISGKVVKADGTPLKDIRVQAYPVQADGSLGQPVAAWPNGMTSSDGTYRLKDLLPGPYEVAITNGWGWGCPTQWYSQVYAQEAAAKATVTASKETTGADFSLAPTGILTGKVTLADGATPAPNVHISVYDFASGSYVACDAAGVSGDIGGATGTDGTFSFRAPAGDYKLQMDVQKIPVGFSGEAISLATAAKVQVRPDTETRANMAVSLGRITGKVTEENKTTPIAGACVTALMNANTGQVEFPACTGTDGTYTLSFLPPGTYKVTAKGPDGNSAHPPYYAAGYKSCTDLNVPCSDVVVTPSGTTANINVALVSTAPKPAPAPSSTLALAPQWMDTLVTGGAGRCHTYDATYHPYVATDAAGSVYLAGIVDTVLPRLNPPTAPSNALLRKYDGTGRLLWTRQFGTKGDECVIGVATSPDDSVVLAGNTHGALPGQTFGGTQDGYVRKYDSAGKELWTHQFGTSQGMTLTGLATDRLGNIFVVGNGKLTEQGQASAFLRKYDSAGAEVWTRALSCPEGVGVYAVAATGNGGAAVGGAASCALPGQPFVGGQEGDAWVRVYDATGAEVWTSEFGTGYADRMTALAVDAAGNVYTGGVSQGDLLKISPSRPIYGSGFVRKYGPRGQALWTQQDANIPGTMPSALAVDQAGILYESGCCKPFTALPDGLTAGPYVRAYAPDGTKPSAADLSRQPLISPTSLSVDKSGHVYMAGVYTVFDQEPTILVVKYSLPAQPAPAPTATPTPIATATLVPTATPTRQPTATPVATLTPRPAPTATPSATPTLAPAAVVPATATPLPTSTPLPQATPVSTGGEGGAWAWLSGIMAALGTLLSALFWFLRR